jgi:hypothetical protein
MPLVTLSNSLQPFLLASAVGSLLYALWVTGEFVRSGRAVVAQHEYRQR